MATQSVRLIGGPMDGQALMVDVDFLADWSRSACIRLVVPPEPDVYRRRALTPRRMIAEYDRDAVHAEVICYRFTRLVD